MNLAEAQALVARAIERGWIQTDTKTLVDRAKKAGWINAKSTKSQRKPKRSLKT